MTAAHLEREEPNPPRKVKIYQRLQTVEAYLITETENGPQYMVREIEIVDDPEKLPLLDEIRYDEFKFVPQNIFESNFTEVPNLGGCCD